MRKLSFKIKIMALSGLLLISSYNVWSPGEIIKKKSTNQNNGLWVGHQWFTGLNLRTGEAVTTRECDDFISLLRSNKIKYVYVHAGRVTSWGTLEQKSGDLLMRLKTETPEMVYLPWVSGTISQIDISNRNWRKIFIETIRELQVAGFPGIHLDIEPVEDWQPGYIELLQEIRNELGKSFFISQATRRLSPWNTGLKKIRRHFWSSLFYMATMHCCDQTVLMGYDTSIRLQKLYIAYIAYQTKTLMQLATKINGHELLIGIPSYEYLSVHSDWRIENIKSALGGVGAAINRVKENVRPLTGVAIFAHWATDGFEWEQYRRCWLASREESEQKK